MFTFVVLEMVADFCYSRRLFVRSLWAWVQPTLDPNAETFILVHCASPGK